jgi:hypothetical protein
MFAAIGASTGASVQKAAAPAATTAAVTKMVPFSKGQGEIAVPAAYAVSYGTGNGLQLIEISGQNVRVYADFHALPMDAGPDDLGLMFVRAQAKTKGLKIVELADRVVMVDPGANTKAGGKTVLNVHRLVGFGKSFVVLSTAVAEDQMNSPQAKKFFDQDLELMILSLGPGKSKKP